MTPLTVNQGIEEIRALLGKQVRVRLTSESDDENVVASGQLIAFDDGGGFVVLDETGFKHYCWPMLEVDVITDDKESR